MKFNNLRIPGLLLSIGAAQFLTMMMLLEAIAPGYSMHTASISDLGTIPETELLFGITLFALGIMNLVGGWFLFKSWGSKSLLSVFTLGSIGAVGAALIPLDSPIGLHSLFALLAFLFLNLEAITVGLRMRGSLRAISVIAGAIGIIFTIAMIFVDSGVLDPSGSIGHGGVERLIAYPALIWMVLFGGYLIARSELEESKHAESYALKEQPIVNEMGASDSAENKGLKASPSAHEGER